MDYEKAYKDALSRAKDCHVNKKFSELDDNAQQLCEYIFPELKMNENEKIRKELIRYLPYCDDISKDTKERWIAWLEKQGKQNSTNSYCKENCKGYKETGKCFADGECKAKKESEQNPAKWSEEDKMILHEIKKFFILNELPAFKESCDIIDWLNKLKPQSHWKPTKEQMDAFREIMLNVTKYKFDDFKLAESLYNDLKKL